MNEYNFVVSSKALNDFVWNDFCNTFIELAKADLNNKETRKDVIATTVYVLKSILIMMHPQCPFITDKIYQLLPKAKTSILKEKWPEKIALKKENEVGDLIKIIESIRRIRSANNTKEHLSINILAKNNVKKFASRVKTYNHYLLALNAEIVNVTNISLMENKITDVVDNFIIEIPTKDLFDNDKEIEKMQLMVKKLEAEVERSRKILANTDFVSKAPKTKVDMEKEKLQKYETQLQNLLESIDSLNLNKK